MNGAELRCHMIGQMPVRELFWAGGLRARASSLTPRVRRIQAVRGLARMSRTACSTYLFPTRINLYAYALPSKAKIIIK